MPGLRVTEAEPEPDGSLTVWAVPHAAARCPGCGAAPSGVHQHVATGAKDVRCGGRRVRLRVHKRRLECGNRSCPVKTFTEPMPPLPPRCRITPRLKDEAASDVTDRGVTPAEAARHAGIAWHTAHDAFAAAADVILDAPLAPVRHLGIDEHRRGKPRWRRDEETGQYELLADRWHTCFSDLSGQQRMIGQAQGRTADDTAYWLAQAPPAWRDRRHRDRLSGQFLLDAPFWAIPVYWTAGVTADSQACRGCAGRHRRAGSGRRPSGRCRRRG